MSNTTQNLSLFKWDATNATDKASRFNIPVSLNENWDNIDAFAGQIREVIGTATDTFSTSETYEVGDIVIHNKALYKCTTAVTTAGEFNSNNWTEISIKDLIDEIKQELEGKVDKVTGKGLSTEDYTTAEKTKLAGIATGAEVNVIETVKVNGTALTPSNKAVDVSVPTKTSDLSNDSGFIDKDVNNLTNYYDKNAVDTKISAVYKYKGTVSTYNDLPSTNLTIGDVYNIETADSTHGVKAGDNVAWNGTAWDVLAGTVDLSGYQTKIDSSHKLESDLVDDTNSTHKFVTSEEKTQISTNATDIDNIKDGTEIDSFGDVETALAEKQDEIDALVEENSTLKKQIPTAHISTTSTQLTDSADELPIEHVKLKGATSQQQYEGYNLIDSSIFSEKTQDGITLTKDSFGNLILNGTATAGRLWTVNFPETKILSAGAYSATITKNTTIGTKLTVSLGNNGETVLGTSVQPNIGIKNISFEQDTSYNQLRMYFQEGTTFSNYKLNYMFLAGTYTTIESIPSYEPYTGGQASPNPSYPQDIHRVTGECNEKVQNDNLLPYPYSDSSKSSNGIDWTVNSDGSIKVNGTGTTSTSYFNCVSQSIGLYLPAGTYTFSINSNASIRGTVANKENVQQVIGTFSTGNSKVTFTLTKPYTLTFVLAVNVGATVDNVTIYPYLIKGSTAPDDYIPHAEQNAPLSLGNIEAYEGDEIQISYVQKAGYKKVTGANLVQNMGKTVFNGSENWYIAGQGFFYYINSEIKIASSGASKEVLSDTYLGDMYNHVYNGLDDYIISSHTVAGRICVRDSRFSTVNDFKENLTNNPITVIYPLATPVTTPITDPTLLAQLETLINMKTYKNITNIESTGADLALVIEFDYYQDMSTLNDRLDELEARIELLEE